MTDKLDSNYDRWRSSDGLSERSEREYECIAYISVPFTVYANSKEQAKEFVKDDLLEFIRDDRFNIYLEDIDI